MNEEQKKEAPAVTGTSASPRAHVDTFQFHSNSLRILSQDGQPWFVLADICDVLGLSNPSAVAARLDDDEKNTLSQIEGISRGNPNITIVNESGMYSVILRSDKPQSKPFRKWITAEVLPTLRRTGTYTLPDGPLIQDILPLPSPTNPAIDLAKVGEVIKAAAQFAREIKPRHREHWIRLTAIGAYRSIYGADISDFLPQPIALFGEAGLTQGSLTGKVAVVNGDTRTTATPSLPEPPPLRSLGMEDVIKVGKRTWWSMLKLEHETGLNQFEILCCLYEHGVCYYETTDEILPWVPHHGSGWIRRYQRTFWSPDLVGIIKARKYYLTHDWPKAWIARQLATAKRAANQAKSHPLDIDQEGGAR